MMNMLMIYLLDDNVEMTLLYVYVDVEFVFVIVDNVLNAVIVYHLNQ